MDRGTARPDRTSGRAVLSFPERPSGPGRYPCQAVFSLCLRRTGPRTNGGFCMKGMLASVAIVAIAAVGLAADKPLAWAQFRGPNGSGVADDQKPPVEFGPDKNVK